MRIAFFCDSYKPYLSGVTNSIELLAKELRMAGHRVYIFAPHYPGHIDTDPDIIRFPSLPAGYPNFRIALPYIYRIPEVDLIHSHSPFQAGLLACYLAKKRKLPLIYTFHTLFTRYVHYARFVPEPISKIALIGYAQRYCNRCDLIITPSKMAKRVLRAWDIHGKVEIVPTGVDFGQINKIPKSIKEELRAKYKIPNDAKVLIYIGRLSKEKNIGFLIKTFEKLSRGFQALYFVLTGAGPEEERIKNLKIKNLILTGEIKYPEVLSYYFMGDIFVFSSITETQGLVLAEAKAAGLPVVALFAGGLVDTVRSGIDGYLVPRNMDNFAGHILRLLNDSALLANMGNAAKEDSRGRFSSAKIAGLMGALYRDLLAFHSQ